MPLKPPPMTDHVHFALHGIPRVRGSSTYGILVGIVRVLVPGTVELLVAVVAHALVALRAVLLAQRVGVEPQIRVFLLEWCVHGASPVFPPPGSRRTVRASRHYRFA